MTRRSGAHRNSLGRLNPRNSRRRLGYEQCEQRTMLSASSGGDDPITIHGTEGDDEIVAFMEEDQLMISVNGAVISFDPSAFDRLDIFGEGGNDTITIDDSVRMATRLGWRRRRRCDHRRRDAGRDYRRRGE